MNHEKKNKIIYSGKFRFEKTEEFIQRAALIKSAIESKFQPIIVAERNIFRRIFLLLKMKFEIRQEIEKVASHRNLHFSH